MRSLIFAKSIYRYSVVDNLKGTPETELSPSGTETWAKKFARTKPIVAVVGDQIVGFAELEPSGHIDCVYCHHEWIGKGVGSALMKEIISRAQKYHIGRIFSELVANLARCSSFSLLSYCIRPVHPGPLVFRELEPTALVESNVSLILKQTELNKISLQSLCLASY